MGASTTATDDEAKAAIEAVLARAPRLGIHGFGPTSAATTRAEVQAQLRQWREAAIQPRAVEQFRTACAWLSLNAHTKRPTAHSYGLKHSAERWGAVNGMSPYVANGMLIIAAYHLGLAVKNTPGNINALVGVSRRTWNALDRAVRTNAKGSSR